MKKELILKDDLSNYDASKYKSPSVTVEICICRIHNKSLEVLLIKRKYPPYRNYWAIPGGFLDIDAKESLSQTAMRELLEETGFKDVYIEQLKTYGDPNRDPRKRVITVVYFALINDLNTESPKAGDDAAEAEWFNIRKLPDLAFDHKEILSDLKLRLEGKIQYAPIAFTLVPEWFTWNQLQQVYEIILDRKLVTSNFRRKINSAYVLSKLNRAVKGKSLGRPAYLLRFESVKQF
jgi:8-oxo-dGTP diphosphatase